MEVVQHFKIIINDLKPDTIFIDKAYVLTKVRPKKFNGSTIISTTIDTNISVSTNEIIQNISDVETTLAMDLTDNKIIKITIDQVGDIHRMITCLTCKGDLVDVASATTLVYCSKCRRHSFKKNTRRNISTTFVIWQYVNSI
ncbi:unnamed protein product [Rotaria magnacalcarata]|nr:unnamed protein product [Rotaria magnacalcarata]